MKRSLFNRRIHGLVKSRLKSEIQGLSNGQAWDAFEEAKLQRQRNWSRREALKLALAGGGISLLAACQTRNDANLNKTRAERTQGGAEKVIIIGAGAAGLTCAYRMMQSGARPVVYEASTRLGGRIFTRREFNSSGQFCELGAELVDSTNVHLIELAKELGLNLQAFAEDPLGPNAEESLFYFKGRVIREKAFFDALGPLLKDVAKDLQKIFGQSSPFFPNYKMQVSEAVRRYDNMSLGDYFKSKKDKAEDWLIGALELSYETEYGGELSTQSSLNFLSLADTSLDDGFTWYGASDEWGRVKGGNSGIIDALAERLKDNIDIELGHSLEALKISGTRLSASFRVGNSSKQIEADRVVIALPFSVLRTIDGARDLLKELSARKQESIRNLTYGTNAKYMLGFSERYWRREDTGRLPASQAVVLSDLKSGQFWETSRGQGVNDSPVKISDPGIVTNFLGGKLGAEVTNEHLNTILADANTLWPGIAQKHDKNSVLMPWARLDFSKGSYTSPGVGQYTKFIGCEGEPELDGRLHFIGEHTSSDWIGFMEGAIETGTRAALALTGKTESSVHLKAQTYQQRRSWKQRV